MKIHAMITLAVIALFAGASASATAAEQWAGSTASVDAGANSIVQVANQQPVDLRPLMEHLYANVVNADFIAMVDLSVAALGNPMGRVVAQIAADIMGVKVDADAVIDPIDEHLLDNSPS